MRFPGQAREPKPALTSSQPPRSTRSTDALSAQTHTSSPSPLSSQSLLNGAEPKLRRPPQRPRFKPHFGWWWEVGAVLVSVACMSLIVTILLCMDGKPLASWPLPMQPNSLVAVFSTITKSALLVPLAECIGQLKWDYFYERPRSLWHMQTFDGASRGPWGALVLLYQTRGSAVLAAFASAITVLMLAFEPFTQQVIEVYAQDAVQLNTSVYWHSAAGLFLENPQPPQKMLFAIISGLLSSLGSSSPIPGYQYCPTAKCRFDDFSTLAMCSACESEVVNLNKDFMNCSYSVQKGVDQRLEWTGIIGSVYPTLRTFMNTSDYDNYTTYKSVREPLVTYPDFISAASKAGEGSVWTKVCSMEFAGSTPVSLLFRIIPQRWLPVSLAQELMYPTSNTTQMLSRLPWSREMTISLNSTKEHVSIGKPFTRWLTGLASGENLQNSTFAQSTVASACMLEKEMDRNVSPLHLARSTCITTSSQPQTIAQLDSFGEMNATVTKCSLRLCSERKRNFSLGLRGINTASTSTSPLNMLHCRGPICTATGALTTFDYHDESVRNLRPLLYSTAGSETFNMLLAANTPTSTQQWTTFFSRIADVFTQTLQSSYNPNATRIWGDAYSAQIFVRVRWPWFIMPLAIVVASHVVLWLTMYRSRRKAYLYRNSILATLFHGLEGGEAQRLLEGGAALEREAYGDLMECARGVRVGLGENEYGVLKLKRE